MASRRTRARRALAAGCCTLAAVLSLTGAAVTNVSAFTAQTRGSGLRVLQFNLCNSAIASCYTGRSVARAVAVIREQRPRVVTLNEVCRNDMPALVQAMSATGTTKTLSAFRAAVDRRTGRWFRCRNGQPYGVGLLARSGSSMPRQHIYSSRYRIQDLTDPEERVWLCIHAVSEFYACTTHTASTSTTVALAQCRSLMTNVAKLLAEGVHQDPVIIGADLNLPARRSPSPQGCVPRGYHRADDGSRQDVIASPQYPVASRSDIDMNGTTDHPGLLVELARAPAPARTSDRH